MAQSKRRTIPLTCVLLLILSCILAGGVFWVVNSIPVMAQKAFGDPAPSLNIVQRIQYAAQLLLARNDLLNPVSAKGVSQKFTVNQGESVNSIGLRLGQGGLVNFAVGLSHVFGF